jgi:hypothetical protein
MTVNFYVVTVLTAVTSAVCNDIQSCIQLNTLHFPKDRKCLKMLRDWGNKVYLSVSECIFILPCYGMMIAAF